MARTATATSTPAGNGMLGIVPWPDMNMDSTGWCGSRDDAASSVMGGEFGASPSAPAPSQNTAANPQEEAIERASRAKQIQTEAATSKSGLWGPTHSLDSSESGYEYYQQQIQREQREQQQQRKQQRELEEQQQNKNKQTSSSPTSVMLESNPNQGGSAGSEKSRDGPNARTNNRNHRNGHGSSHTGNNHCDYGSPAQAAMESIWNRAGTLFSPAAAGAGAANPTKSKSNSKSNSSKSTCYNATNTLSSKLDVIGEACSNAPCLARNRNGVTSASGGANAHVDSDTLTTDEDDEEEEEAGAPCYGIAPMSLDVELTKASAQRRNGQGLGQVGQTGTDSTESGNGTGANNSNQNVNHNSHKNGNDDSPAGRRRARHLNRLVQREQLLTVYDEIEVASDDQIRVVSSPTDACISELRQPLPRTQSQLAAQAQALLQSQQSQSLQKLQPSQSPPTAAQNKTAPLQLLEVEHEQAMELERSISELTMRSSYGEQAVASRIPDNRRMAYYAVGKHHRQSGRGGNRRCYFTGKLILGGAPFYAGSVQQGLRTLVVFCLPSALGLPNVSDAAWHSHQSHHKKGGSHSISSRSPIRRVASRELSRAGASSNRSISVTASHQSMSSHHGEQRSSLLSRSKQKSNSNGNNGVNNNPMVRGGGGSERDHYGSSSVASKSMGQSRLSSLDDLSLSIDGDLDPNWGLDRDYLLKVLPDPDIALLKSMAKLYPEQFETLPVQVRDATKWKLYVKFCFFSGLPIAQGEMHYKVRDDIAESSYGEEIVLSHDVMEAVNGESAEILSLPNLKAFRYLRKHYAQQCGKLEGGDRVFLRTSWERVLSEV
jgi:hypothetical protein